MTRYVRNPAGTVQSVPDDFAYPKDLEGNTIGNWQEATAADASPELLGTEQDPQVVFAELRNH